MKVESFQALLAQVPSLTEVQLDGLALAVELRRSKTKSTPILVGAWGASKCGHCASEQAVKNGHCRGIQRYRCRACDRTFNVTTGTPERTLFSAGRAPRQGHDRAKCGCRLWGCR